MPALQRSSIAIVAAKSIALAEFEKCSRIAARSRLESMTSEQFSRDVHIPSFASNSRTANWEEEASSTPKNCREELVLFSGGGVPGKDLSGGSCDPERGSASTSSPRLCSETQLHGSALDSGGGPPCAEEKDDSAFASPSDDMRLAIQFLENRFGKLVGISTLREIIEMKEVAVLTQLEFEWTAFQQWGSACRSQISLARALRLAFEDSIVVSVAHFSPSFIS